MRALTLHQPWAALVASGVKRIENRSWPPPPWMWEAGWMFGPEDMRAGDQRFAIHAGAKFDQASYDKAVELAPESEVPCRGECPSMAILATARVVAVARTVNEAIMMSPGGEQGRWFFGPYGWILDDIRELVDPIPCRGRQKLWAVPEKMREQIAATKAVFHR